MPGNEPENEPKNEFHRWLIMQTAELGPDIPNLAAWEGQIVKSMRRLRKDFNKSKEEIKKNGWSRVAGALTNSTVVGKAIERYHAGVKQVEKADNQLSKAILGSLLVDIYTVTGQFMRSIRRNKILRTDCDCALYPLYRDLNCAAADAFGKVFGINGDEIDVYLRNQLIFMSTHGVAVDTNVGEMMRTDAGGEKTSRLVYLSNEQALAYQLHVEDGLLKIRDGHNKLQPFDCSKGKYINTANTARQGPERNGRLGVAGFAMGLNRSIYARIHSNSDVARGSFYHSSYLEGGDVLCTGCITVVDGKLTYINNWSGHYQPRPEQLRLAVQTLQALGVDMAEVVVEAQQPDRTQKFLRASEFLDLAGARIDATAVKVKKALEAYEERSNGWFSNPSEKSKKLLKHLKGIRIDETLVREVRFLLGGNLKNNLQLESPRKTSQDMRFSQGDKSQLRDMLIEAMAEFERYFER